MGQGQSEPIPEIQTEPEPKTETIKIPQKSRKMLVTGSLVAGSPLTTVEQYSAQDKEYMKRATPVNINAANAPFVQPLGEPSYKNSSKIVHSFGAGGAGIAPLVSIGSKIDKKVPVMITWSGGGKSVYLTGSFNNWKQKIRLQKSTNDFTTVVDMPVGKHNLKFVVDDEWKCSEDLPTASDADGNLVNYLEIFDEETLDVGDGLDRLGGNSTVTESPPGSYSCDIPPYLQQIRKRSSMIDDCTDEIPPLLPAQLNKDKRWSDGNWDYDEISKKVYNDCAI